MQARAQSTPHSRSTEAALELVRRMEADLREIRYRVTEQSEEGERWISPEDNQDLNSMRREVNRFLDSVSEAAA